MKKIFIILLAIMAFGILNGTKQIIFDTDVPCHDLRWSYYNYPGQTPSPCAYHNVETLDPGLTTFNFNTPHYYQVSLNYFDYNACMFVTRTFTANLIDNDQVVITIRGLCILNQVIQAG